MENEEKEIIETEVLFEVLEADEEEIEKAKDELTPDIEEEISNGKGEEECPTQN